MLRRIVSNLAPNTVRQRILVWGMLPALMLTVSLVGCSTPTLITEPALPPEPTPSIIPTQELGTAPAPSPLLYDCRFCTNIFNTPIENYTPIAEPSPATFQITDLRINPVRVNPGEPILIAATITNTSERECICPVELKINDIAKLVTEVTLPAGETREFSVSGREEIPGAYNVNLGELNGQFVVEESVETLILSSPDPDINVPDQDIGQDAGQGTRGCCGGGSTNQSTCGCSGGLPNQSICGCSGRLPNQSTCGCGDEAPSQSTCGCGRW
jgi:hypothetical protein